MRLLFDKEIEFIKSKINGEQLYLPSRSCFVNNMIIYAFNQMLIKQPLYKLRVKDGKLEVVRKYNFFGEPISWDEVIYDNKERLDRLEKESLETIYSFIKEYKVHEPLILTSGGKDSSVTSYLTRRLISDCKGRFDNTSLDVADTYLHVKSLENVEISNPEIGFYQWREQYNFIPTRFARACCSIFKEGNLIKDLPSDKKILFFMGMRNEESCTRSSYKDKWINEKWGKRDWVACLPIRKWTELDVWLYIVSRGIPINPKYEKGYSRVGCSIACPFYNEYTWLLDEYWYPLQYKRWHDILEKDFIDNRKWTRLNCTLEEYHTNWNGGLVREEPTKEVVEEMANYMNLKPEIAEKYFNNKCSCSKKLSSDEIGLNFKFYIDQDSFLCKSCLSDKLNIPLERLNHMIESFKLQGCTLF